MAEENKRLTKKIKIIIAVLLALLVLSIGALTVRVVYVKFFRDNVATAVVPDNLIGDEETASSTTSVFDTSTPNPNKPESEDEPSSGANDDGNGTYSKNKATVIELYNLRPSDNEKFKVENMLPGDSQTKYYAVQVSHHAKATVYFNAEVTEQTKALGNVLNIKVTQLDTCRVLYNGSFANMSSAGYGTSFDASGKTETLAYYKIEVSLPTSAGNEYQAAKLVADFNWSVKDTSTLDSPNTGDSSNIMLCFVIMCCSLAVIIILLFTKRKERKANGNGG